MKKLKARLRRVEEKLEAADSGLAAARQEASRHAAALEAAQAASAAAAADAARRQAAHAAGGTGANPLLGLPPDVPPALVGAWFEDFVLHDER